MVAAYWFRSSKTGASASRECSSCVGRRNFGVHVNHEVGVGGKERHLAFRIASIGAARVGFDEFANREAIRSFLGRDRDAFAHELSSLGLKDGTGFEEGLDPVSSVFTAHS